MLFPLSTRISSTLPINYNAVEPPHFKLDKLQSKKVISNESIILTVKARGTDLIYQWFKDGASLSEDHNHYQGVTTPNLFINKASLQHKGKYHCVVSNEGGEAHSQPRILTVGEL